MYRPVGEIIGTYDSSCPLELARTIPSAYYTDPRIAGLEARTVFSGSWQMVARAEQVALPGQYVTAELAGEPIVAVRGNDGVLRAFFNVCRHHAAAVMTLPEGKTPHLRCPYHGWTYTLEGELKGTPDFQGVCEFERSSNGLVPIACGVWEKFVFVRLDATGPSLPEFIGADLIRRFEPLGLGGLHFMERRHYDFECNWKVFVDNYLDGGYHVPFLHTGLDSVLDYSKYTIENGERFCLQQSPIVSVGAEPRTGAVRKGERALYYWLYPNFMINWYEGVMDTNLVLPLGVDRTLVVFDFYFPDVTSPEGRARNLASIEVGQRIQDEDTAICKSVQRGLLSRAYDAGRLSVRREAGEHLFHRLLHADLKRGLAAAL
ncbi:MAG TPA: aromatic ring-hydroxylating dioxygenase subunit alpha [Candidatus Polarisedimenticolia bacterium]|jgi:choline monooxygenase